jgi:hypothetical protein
MQPIGTSETFARIYQTSRSLINLHSTAKTSCILLFHFSVWVTFHPRSVSSYILLYYHAKQPYTGRRTGISPGLLYLMITRPVRTLRNGLLRHDYCGKSFGICVLCKALLQIQTGQALRLLCAGAIDRQLSVQT